MPPSPIPTLVLSQLLLPSRHSLHPSCLPPPRQRVLIQPPTHIRSTCIYISVISRGPSFFPLFRLLFALFFALFFLTPSISLAPSLYLMPLRFVGLPLFPLLRFRLDIHLTPLETMYICRCGAQLLTVCVCAGAVFPAYFDPPPTPRAFSDSMNQQHC